MPPQILVHCSNWCRHVLPLYLLIITIYRTGSFKYIVRTITTYIIASVERASFVFAYNQNKYRVGTSMSNLSSAFLVGRASEFVADFFYPVGLALSAYIYYWVRRALCAFCRLNISFLLRRWARPTCLITRLSNTLCPCLLAFRWVYISHTRNAFLVIHKSITL